MEAKNVRPARHEGREQGSKEHRRQGLVGVATIMRDLHHIIALQIEEGRVAHLLTDGVQGDMFAELGSVSALNENEDGCI